MTDSKGASSFCVATVMVYDSAPPWLVLQPDRSAISAVARTGQVVVVQVSTNLVNWTSIRTNTIGSSPAEFDPHVGGQPKGFYRFKLWP